MIVQNRQWMTPTTPRQFEVTLEIHLPQIVGKGMLEPLPGGRNTRSRNGQQPRATQDARDGARGRRSSTIKATTSAEVVSGEPSGRRD